MADKKRQATGRKKIGEKRRAIRRLFYRGGLLAVLTMLVILAFHVPQFIFQVQDNILCGDTVLGKRESMDVETLSTTYERSLGKRMQNFAEGHAAGDSFYITSQNFTVDETLEEYLYSEEGVYQNLIYIYIEHGMMPEIWSDDFSVNQWKRYVIYSDDFAKGVNFILWYIELENQDGVMCKLLVDAEDGKVYAVKAENNDALERFPRISFYENRKLWRYDEMLTQMWSVYALYYEALTQDEASSLFELMKKLGWSGIQGIPDYDSEYASEDVMDNASTLGVDLQNFWEGTAGYRWESADSVSFQLPYGENSLEVKAQIIELTNEIEDYELDFYYPDVLIGVRQIYELIPEFS